MIGNNKLLFNEATMIGIVQHYLEDVMLQDDVKVKVTSVKQNRNGNAYHETDLFEIQLEDVKP